MAKKYYDLAFTDEVKKAQSRNGSRKAFARDNSESQGTDKLGADETAFIQNSDSFYMASVNSTGWPYVQHRGGAVGFLKVQNPSTLVMPDFRGNRQYISVGNFADNDKVSLFFMDYPRQGRLKIFARAKIIELDENQNELQALLTDDNYGAKIERAIQFSVEGFDWNCPQHITPRYTQTDIANVTRHMTNKIAELEEELKIIKKAP